MEDRPLSGTQKLFLRLFGGTPERRAAIEAESRSWIIECTACRYRRSFWDEGGVRYKAWGNEKRLARCPHCNRTTWSRVFRSSPPGVPGADPLPAGAMPRWLTWTLLLGGIAAAVGVFVIILAVVLGNALQPVITAGDSFMADLQNADYAQAYTRCAPELQQQLGTAAHLGTLEVGRPPVHWAWTSRSIRNGVGRLSGTVTYSDGKSGTVQLTFREVDSAWKLTSFTLTPTAP